MDPSLPLLSVAAVDRFGERPLASCPADRWLAHRSGAPVPRLRPGDPLLLLRRGGRPACPHCAGREVQRWGRFGNTRRYRCSRCARTFSEFTGTTLYRLRRKDRWPAFCRCMADGNTVRRAAVLTGVHRNTAFRWRHRLLRGLRATERHPLGPTICLGESRVYRDTWLVFGLDERGRAAGTTVGRRRAGVGDVRSLLEGRIARSRALVSIEGPAGVVARFARGRRLSWSRRRIIDATFDGRIEPVQRYAFRFRWWLRRFRGVSRRYMDNYLAWFRLVDGRMWHGACRGAVP